ncbi:hypothetical protein FSP39_023924 [Pinctada imbricata]|uniref:Carboxylesterase type B domain-containing protein n=1 Tax=Pinctada imbricata TaxID=66713 RepID=A0AA89C7H9_PINIB|nr:hypothetical protein FSP39_023924 [Pinctada imbricata]
MEPFIENCTHIREAVCDMYTPHGNNKSLAMQSFLASQFLTDIIFLASTDLLLSYHATKASSIVTKKTYQYYFTHVPAWELIQAPRPKWLTGPNHASELTFVFGMDWYPSDITISKQERDLSNRMIDYWTNFAKTGDPNSNSSTGLTNWEPYTSSKKSYLRIDLSDSLETNLQLNESYLLNSQISDLLQDCRSEKNYTVVSSKLGLLKGRRASYNGTTVYQFKKVPYAQPPIGEFRFSKPVHHEPWADLRDAQTFGFACYQSGTYDSEDCLFLNVFVPRNLSTTPLRPVMIWIHGGGFTTGRIDTTDGSLLALFGDVIVVTIQYRLNVFGFFSLNVKPFMGNYGLYDQKFAIEWVKNNIASFGGDPDQITLFGESAGGVSTTLQAIMPSNKGLFSRVIGESGSALARRDFQTKTFETSKRILDNVGCAYSSNDQILTCLRSKDEKTIFDAYVKAAKNVSIVYSLTTTIGPIVDGKLIPQTPLAALENSSSDMYRTFSSIDILQLIPKFARNILPVNPNASLQEQSQMAANLYGDLLEDAPTVRFLELHDTAKNTKSYQYLFAHRPRWEVISVRPQWLIGSNHASEVPFVFGLLRQWYPKSVPVMDDEVNLSDRIMTYWTNFAKYGNPNGHTGDDWPAYDVTSRKYLVLDITDHVNSSLYSNRMTFWNTEIAKDVKVCKTKEIDTDLSTGSSAKKRENDTSNGSLGKARSTSIICCAAAFSFLLKSWD